MGDHQVEQALALDSLAHGDVDIGFMAGVETLWAPESGVDAASRLEPFGWCLSGRLLVVGSGDV